MAYSFQKMFFIGQNLKHIHMMYYFLKLLIFFWLTLHCLEFISDHAKEVLHVKKYKLHGKPIMKWKQRFSLVSAIDVEKTSFFNVKLNLFMNYFYKHTFQSSHLQMFFKIGALKNFAILRIKKRLQHRCFPVRSSHTMITYW